MAAKAGLQAEDRRGRNSRAALVFFLLIATAVFATHYPLWNMPYFWDEMGQFRSGGA